MLTWKKIAEKDVVDSAVAVIDDVKVRPSTQIHTFHDKAQYDLCAVFSKDGDTQVEVHMTVVEARQLYAALSEYCATNKKPFAPQLQISVVTADVIPVNVFAKEAK